MTKQLITGLHHVTAMAGSAQENVNFYTGLLGLRLVKKTVNFDAPDVYHLYYGDETGKPGSIMTFFPFRNMRPGRRGMGQVATTSFSIPKTSVDFWLKRLEQFEVAHDAPRQRFDETVIFLRDNDGLGVELVANDRDTREPFTYGHIPLEHSIRGFYGVELWENAYEATERLLVNQMDHRFIAEEGDRRRYATDAAGSPGQLVDIRFDAARDHGTGGAGTVHHVAFNTPTDEDQLAVREKLTGAGLGATQVLDRQYFHSIYFREPGGVLFEVATAQPGFLYDENRDHLGQGLKLPPWEEERRAYIEKLLQPITLNPEQYASPS